MIWTLYQQTEFSEEKRRCLHALGKSKEPALLGRLLEFCLTKEVRSQDIAFPIGSVSSNPKGRRVTWDFFVSNWNFFDENFNKGGQNFVVGSVVGSVASVFSREEDAQMISDFFRSNPMPSAESTLRQSLETVRVNAARIQRDRLLAPSWLSQNGY